jgi:hypothetical protein
MSAPITPPVATLPTGQAPPIPSPIPEGPIANEDAARALLPIYEDAYRAGGPEWGGLSVVIRDLCNARRGTRDVFDAYRHRSLALHADITHGRKRLAAMEAEFEYTNRAIDALRKVVER